MFSSFATKQKSNCNRPVYVVCRDHSLHWIVVAVRGTLSQNDILTDCAVSGVPFLGGVDGNITEFFWAGTAGCNLVVISQFSYVFYIFLLFSDFSGIWMKLCDTFEGTCLCSNGRIF